MGIQTDEFVIQAREHLAVLEQVLLSLEKPDAGTDDRERIDRCLRIVHSIKGDAGFLGYTTVRTLANAIETVLETMRNEGCLAPASAVERLLAARDRLAALVDDLENSQRVDLGGVLSQLDQVELSIKEAAGEWDIDLRELDSQRSGRLAEFFASFAHFGVITAAAIDVASADLARGLPEGPVRFRARLDSATPRDEIGRLLGLPD